MEALSFSLSFFKYIVELYQAKKKALEKSLNKLRFFFVGLAPCPDVRLKKISFLGNVNRDTAPLEFTVNHEAGLSDLKIWDMSMIRIV